MISAQAHFAMKDLDSAIEHATRVATLPAQQSGEPGAFSLPPSWRADVSTMRRLCPAARDGRRARPEMDRDVALAEADPGAHRSSAVAAGVDATARKHPERHR